MGQSHSRRRNRRVVTTPLSPVSAVPNSPRISPILSNPIPPQEREQEMATFGALEPFTTLSEESSFNNEEVPCLSSEEPKEFPSDLPVLLEEVSEEEMEFDSNELPPLDSDSMEEEVEEVEEDIEEFYTNLSSLFESPLSQDETTQTTETTTSLYPNSSSQGFRLNIIYYVPYRRNRNNGQSETSEETSEQESAAPTSLESLFSNGNFRVLFALTIPMGMGMGGNLSSMEGNPFGSEGSFEDLLDHLMRQHQPQGPPPTSKSALNKLKSTQVNEEMTQETCLVCQENFVLEETALKLPCKHLFHKDCVTTWLEKHCTCPTCRYELPVDDKDYETERKKRMAGRNIDENNYEDTEMEIDSESLEESDKFLVEKCSSPAPQEHKETIPLSSQ